MKVEILFVVRARCDEGGADVDTAVGLDADGTNENDAVDDADATDDTANPYTK
ncbi:hypothetical protein OCU04_010315 [Sclerotinia nivalis]|uniref:Uncharacterized protein n=1 Tax=Sclerotinia nivalis TaxID=352851 RepID=A0A9X0DG60_9HELO|nr:hypothetical protein OCU04_010315 [Sclerotinia nivalis]